MFESMILGMKIDCAKETFFWINEKKPVQLEKLKKWARLRRTKIARTRMKMG